MKFCPHRRLWSQGSQETQQCTYPHFVPDIVIALEHGEVMLYGHDETVAIHQSFGQIARQVCPWAHGNDWRFGDLIVLAEAERTSRKDLLRLFIV